MSTLLVPSARRHESPVELAGERRRPERWLAGALLAIAAGLAAVALLGPLALGLVDYHVTETLRNQTIGLDAVSLLVVAPLAVAAAVLVLRGHVAGPALALGIGAYTAYMFVQYVVGPEYERLPGNNEVLFPLYLVLFSAGWIVALGSWGALDAERVPGSRRRDRVVGRIVLPLLAVAVFSRYVPALLDWTRAQPEDAGYLAGPTFAWTIALLDLGVFLPATVAACVGLVRGARWAQQALLLVAGWLALVGAAVAAMAVVMVLNDDPTASTAAAVVMVALGLASASLAFVVLRPLVRGAPSRVDARVLP